MYQNGKLALFLVPAEKLHGLTSFAGDNDALPQRHRDFMQSKGALSFTPTAAAKAPACTQEMREIVWMKFSHPQLPHGQDYRDLVRKIFSVCHPFELWLHAALGTPPPPGSRPSAHESGNASDAALHRGRTEFQFQGPPSNLPKVLQPQQEDSRHALGRGNYDRGDSDRSHHFAPAPGRDPRGQFHPDIAWERERSFQGRSHAAPPPPNSQYRDHRDYAPPLSGGETRREDHAPGPRGAADSRRDHPGRPYTAHAPTAPAFPAERDERRVRSRAEEGAGRRSGWDDRR